MLVTKTTLQQSTAYAGFDDAAQELGRFELVFTEECRSTAGCVNAFPEHPEEEAAATKCVPVLVPKRSAEGPRLGGR